MLDQYRLQPHPNKLAEKKLNNFDKIGLFVEENWTFFLVVFFVYNAKLCIDFFSKEYGREWIRGDIDDLLAIFSKYADARLKL